MTKNQTLAITLESMISGKYTRTDLAQADIRAAVALAYEQAAGIASKAFDSCCNAAQQHAKLGRADLRQKAESRARLALSISDFIRALAPEDAALAALRERYAAIASDKVNLRSENAMLRGKVEKLVEALRRQGDNMAFTLNNTSIYEGWHEKFTRELEEDRAALSEWEVK